MFSFGDPHHLVMLKNACNTERRLVGVIQPKSSEGYLFAVGCAARIETLQVLDDGLHSAYLRGFSRFRLTKIISEFHPCRPGLSEDALLSHVAGLPGQDTASMFGFKGVPGENSALISFFTLTRTAVKAAM